MTESTHQRLFLITGMSGSGRTSVLKSLEDMSVEAVDNLPLNLLRQFVETAETATDVAVALDTRTRGFTSAAMLAAVTELKQASLSHRALHQPILIYLDCDDDIILRRYTETRRRHPLSKDQPIAEAIAAERAAMAPLKEAADEVIDTTSLKARDLRAILGERYGAETEGARMSVVLESFAFRNGLPREADLVFDVRFLRNPHYNPDLKHKTGQSADVSDFIMQDGHFAPFFAQLNAMITLLLPLYRAEGKTHLTIAIGCTGGQHRSVFIAERLNSLLGSSGWHVTLRHRETENWNLLPKDKA